MRARQILRDILSFLILGLAVFFFAGGFAWDLAEDFFGSPFDLVECLVGLFIFTSLSATIATCICRLCRIHFKFRKAEKTIAIAYLSLAVLSIYPLFIVSVFSTLTFSPDASLWLITRNILSVLAMVISVIWLAVLSARLLIKTREQ